MKWELTMKKNIFTAFALISSLAMHLPALATQTATAQMNFSGTLIEPASCTVNNSQPINVTFGDVPIGDLNSDPVNSTHTASVNYSLDCSSNANNASMELKISGTGESINGRSGLVTDIPGLLIFFKFYTATFPSQVFPVNSGFPFTYPSRPTITAVLAKTASSTLTTGTFSATATMTLTYP